MSIYTININNFVMEINNLDDANDHILNVYPKV